MFSRVFIILAIIVCIKGENTENRFSYEITEDGVKVSVDLYGLAISYVNYLVMGLERPGNVVRWYSSRVNNILTLQNNVNDTEFDITYPNTVKLILTLKYPIDEKAFSTIQVAYMYKLSGNIHSINYDGLLALRLTEWPLTLDKVTYMRNETHTGIRVQPNATTVNNEYPYKYIFINATDWSSGKILPQRRYDYYGRNTLTDPLNFDFWWYSTGMMELTVMFCDVVLHIPLYPLLCYVYGY